MLNICKCGHNRKEHNFSDDGSNAIIIDKYGDSWCHPCAVADLDFRSFHQFKLDNLKSLEALEEEKNG